jgi:hypothetical protein
MHHRLDRRRIEVLPVKRRPRSDASDEQPDGDLDRSGAPPVVESKQERSSRRM